jgi:hypothetical protein
MLGMMYKLSVHAAKGPWDQKTLRELVQGLESEVVELKEALAQARPYPEILDECADIANYCLMIADHVDMVGEELNPSPPIEPIMYHDVASGRTLQRCAYISDAGQLCIKLLNHKDGHDFDPMPYNRRDK